MAGAELSGERAAENQSLYRSVNERIKELNTALGEIAPGGDPYEWLCECADTVCTIRVSATVEEYESVRENPRAFVVAPRHVYPEVERVLAKNSRFTIVEKLDDAGKLAEARDPRRDDPPSQ